MAVIANLLKENSFEINMPSTPILASVVTSIDIAGTTLNEANLPHVNLDYNVPGEKLVYGKLDVTFLVDENLDSFMEVYNSMVATAGPTSLESKRKEWYQDVSVNILNNSRSDTVRTITFIDCWFTFLGNLSFDNAGSGNIVSAATLSFSHFEVGSVATDTTGFDKITYQTDILPPDPFA